MANGSRAFEKTARSYKTLRKTKITILALTAALLVSLCGCNGIGNMSRDRETAIDEATAALQDDLTTAFTACESPQDMLDAVVSFADENEIYYKVINDNSVIVVKQAADESSDFPDITMHCSLSSEEPAESAAQSAAVLSALKEASNVSRTTAIITVRDGLFYTGAMALPLDYLSTDYLINLSDSESPAFYTNSVSLDTHRFTHSVTKETVDGHKAYELTLDGLARSTPEEIDEEQTDPVLIFYEILSWCESSHIDYHLVSLSAGDSAETLPQGASMTLLVDPTDIGKFQNKVYGMIDEFKEEHGTEPDSPTFTLHHIDAPTQAISAADATELVGLIYTLLSNYEYLTCNETDKTVGRQDFSMVNISTSGISFTISCRFLDASAEHDDSGTFKELARLSGFDVQEREIYPRWTPEEESPVRMTFDRCADQAGLSLKEESTCEILETGVFAMKSPGLSQLAVGISPDDCSKAARALILFIETAGQSF